MSRWAQDSYPEVIRQYPFLVALLAIHDWLLIISGGWSLTFMVALIAESTFVTIFFLRTLREKEKSWVPKQSYYAKLELAVEMGNQVLGNTIALLLFAGFLTSVITTV